MHVIPKSRRVTTVTGYNTEDHKKIPAAYIIAWADPKQSCGEEWSEGYDYRVLKAEVPQGQTINDLNFGQAELTGLQ